jgi:hypothetical protein
MYGTIRYLSNKKIRGNNEPRRIGYCNDIKKWKWEFIKGKAKMLFP